MTDTNPLDQHIHDLMALTVGALNYESLAAKIVEYFAQLFSAELCTLWRRVQQAGEDRLILSANTGGQLIKPGVTPPTYILPPAGTPNNEIAGVTAWIAVRDQVCRANSFHELAEDPHKPWHGTHRGKWDKDQFLGDRKFENLLGLPISYQEGKTWRVIGVLKIETTREPGGFSPASQRRAEQLLPYVAIALQRMDTHEQYEQERQRKIRDLMRALLRQDPTTFLQEVVNQTAELLKADICSLWLIEDNNRVLRLGANIGVQQVTQSPEYSLDWSAEDKDIGGLTPWVAIRKQAFFGEHHEDLRNHPAWRGKWDKDQWSADAASNFGCLYAVPLLNVEREPLGVLKIENRLSKQTFNDLDRATFDMMAEFIALALEFNSRLRSDIVYDFFHLLKQPVSNSIMAFRSLRQEISRPRRRLERINSRLEMVALNLQTVRTWTMNVYGLAATPHDVPSAKTDDVAIQEMLSKAIINMKQLFPEFDCQLVDLAGLSIAITPLQSKKIDALLFNILDNSFKYSNPPRQIRAIASLEPEWLRVTIQDNGLGIAPEDLPHIFKPYFTRGAEKWPSSMGLGLATVARLIQEMGWDKAIDSDSSGTRFHVLIPRPMILLSEGEKP